MMKALLSALMILSTLAQAAMPVRMAPKAWMGRSPSVNKIAGGMYKGQELPKLTANLANPAVLVRPDADVEDSAQTVAETAIVSGEAAQQGDAVEAAQVGDAVGRVDNALEQPKAFGARASYMKRVFLGLFTAAALMMPLDLSAQAANGPEKTPAGMVQQLLKPNTLTMAVVQEKQGYVRVDNVDEMIAASKLKHRSLIVVGDVGLNDGQLQALAKKVEGKQWTLVLVENAAGQRFNSNDGSVKRDDYAYEFAIGEVVMNTQGVKEQTHSLTGQRSGKVLLVAIAQRAHVYWGSEAQDAQQLGDKQYPGNLDQWFKAAMQNSNGTDVVGAVESTVSNIDAKVEAAIKSDFKTAPEQIAAASAKIDELSMAAAKFRQSHPKSSLGRVDTAPLKTAVASAQDQLDAKRPWDASAKAQAVTAQISSQLDAMANFETLAAQAKNEAKLGQADVAALEADAAKVRVIFPKATGALVNPDVKALREALAAASAQAVDDPRASLAASAKVREQVKSLSAELRGYMSGENDIFAVGLVLEAVAHMERASAASSELQAARQSLDEARRLWTKGEPGFEQKLEAARNSTQEASRVVEAADRRARAAFITLVSIASILSLGLLLLGLFLHLRVVKPVRKRVEGFYKDWDTQLDDRLLEMNGTLLTRLQTAAGPAEGEGVRPHAGRTKKLVEVARDNVGTYDVLWTLANNTLNAAEKLVHPKGFGGKLYNYFWHKRYKLAEIKLSKELLEFGDKGLASVFGQEEATHKDKLYGNPKDKAIKVTFEQLIARLNATAKAADEALELIEKSTDALVPTVEGAEKAIALLTGEIKGKLERHGHSDGLFQLPSLFSAVVPAIERELAELKKKHINDPVGAIETSGMASERISTEALALADAVEAFRTIGHAQLVKDLAVLSAQGLVTEWIDKSLNKLSGRAEKLAASVITEPISAKIDALKVDSINLAAQVNEAARLAALLKDLQEKRAPAADQKIIAARTTVSEALGIDFDKALAEKDYNPTDRMDGVRQQAGAMIQALGTGDVKAAAANLAEADKLMGETQFIVERSLKQLADNETETAARLAETSRLEALIPEHEAILESIEKDFAPSVLALNAGDPAHPNGDGTAKNNVQEANENLASAKAKQAKAAAAFRAGKLIEADMLIDQIGGHQEFMAHRLGEIAEKRARLDQAVADNAKKALALKNTLTSFQQEYVEDKRTMKPSLSAYKQASSDYEEAKSLVDAKKGDPFKAQAALAALAAALTQFEIMAKNDRDVYAEAKNSLVAAQRQLDAARLQAGNAKKDEHGDSDAIKKGYRDIAELESALNAAQTAFDKPHNDFNAIDTEADRVTSAAAKIAAVIKGELAEAEEAASDISRAASKVREASGWTGSYGVSIPGSPGSGSLDRARELLRNGKYKEAQGEAESAYAKAAAAISEAEADVRRKRREEEERQERAREAARAAERAREQRSSGSSYGGGGSSGGGRSSYGGGSSGGGRSSW